MSRRLQQQIRRELAKRGAAARGPAGVGSPGPQGAAGVGVPAGGSTNQVLAKASGTDYDTAWVPAAAGSGDVVGPASATDNAIARFDGTTGKLVQNSVVALGDSGVLSGFTRLEATPNTSPRYSFVGFTGTGLTYDSDTEQLNLFYESTPVFSYSVPDTEVTVPTLLVTDLAGTGTRMVTASSTGALATAPIPTVYVATKADTAINSVTDVTIVTRDVTGVGATDSLNVEAEFTILNNSTATRVYVITLDFDGLFDVEFSTGALAFSSTLMHPFFLRGTLDIRSTSLCYGVFTCEGQLAAGIASGTDTTMAATHLRAMGWGTSASDASGTCTVALKIRSANATATQTLRLHRMVITKHTPT